jgi:hypothetical protein
MSGNYRVIYLKICPFGSHIWVNKWIQVFTYDYICDFNCWIQGCSGKRYDLFFLVNFIFKYVIILGAGMYDEITDFLIF